MCLLERGETVKVDKSFYDRCWACLDHEAGATSRENLYSENVPCVSDGFGIGPFAVSAHDELPSTTICNQRHGDIRNKPSQNTHHGEDTKAHTQPQYDKCWYIAYTYFVALHRHEVWVSKGPRGWSFQAVPDLPSLVDCRSSYVGETFALACFKNRKYSPAMCGKMCGKVLADPRARLVDTKGQCIRYAWPLAAIC